MLAIAFGEINIILHLQEYLLHNNIVVQYSLASGWMISGSGSGLLALLQHIFGQNIVKQINGLSYSS